MNHRYRREAVDELYEAHDYYEKLQPSLGRRFVEDYKNTLNRILENPNCGGDYEAGCKILALRKFPYGIIYRHRSNVVEIVVVMQLYRKPGYWISRVSDEKH